jgi:hypothetical protein
MIRLFDEGKIGGWWDGSGKCRRMREHFLLLWWGASAP